MGKYRQYLESHAGGDGMSPTVQNLASLLQQAHGEALNVWGYDLRANVSITHAYNLADLLDTIAATFESEA